MSQHAVEQWLEDGAANAENFYLAADAEEDDSCPPVLEIDGAVAVSANGMFTFHVQLAAPFAILMEPAPTNAAMKRFLRAANADPHKSVTAALAGAREAFVDVAEDLYDDEQANGTASDSGDSFPTDYAQEENAAYWLPVASPRPSAELDTALLTKPAVERLLSDYTTIRNTTHHGWTAFPAQRALRTWTLKLTDFGDAKELVADMVKWAAGPGNGEAAIELAMSFPNDYPFAPPFVRVVKPRFVDKTSRVMRGGCVCSEVLTSDGWNPIFDIAAIIETVRLHLLECPGGVTPRVDFDCTDDYSEEEARAMFRVVEAHHRRVGWSQS